VADQRVVVGTLADIADRVASAALPTPALAIVGAVVSLRETLRWFDAMPLFGKRVLVTRAEQSASEMSSLLMRRGARPIEVALIDVADPPDLAPARQAVEVLGTYDAVGFTSANAVDRFFALLDEAGRDGRAFGRARIACVGDATARAIAARGLRPDVVPAVFRGEALADAIASDLAALDPELEGRRVLLPRALVAREVLPDMLRARGITVDVAPVYRTVRLDGPEQRAIPAMLRDGSIEVVTLASGSAAEALCDLLGPGVATLPSETLVAAIGDVTAKAARARGLRVDVVADASTTEGLVDAIERRLGP
jgi:uroporphyrinogen III methyltransferase/synthase